MRRQTLLNRLRIGVGRAVSNLVIVPAVPAVLVVAIGVTGVWPPAVATAQEHAGTYSQEDIERGLAVYSVTCTTCHGPGGDRVDGVELRSGQFERAPTDEALTELIRTGIPGTAMPPGEYSDAELMGLVAYLRTMGATEVNDASVGDAARGQSVYRGKGDCARCHQIDGDGSRLGPDLSAIGRSRTAQILEHKLLDPTATLFPINRPVRVVTQDGTVFTGRRLNEDTHTVQIIDQDERLRSFEKSALRELTIMDDSTMPAFGDVLNPEEISDLVAYLLSLRGLER